MYFICAYLLKYENGKLSQSEISRCSHLKFNGRLLAWGWRVGGRWEIFHTQNVTSHVNKFSTLVSLGPYFWCTEVSGSSRKVGDVDSVLGCMTTETHLSQPQHRWQAWLGRTMHSVSCLDTGTSLTLCASWAQARAKWQLAAKGSLPTPLDRKSVV